MFSKEMWWFGLEACLYCGSISRQPDGLCRSCSDNLWSWQPPEEGLYHQKIDHLHVQSLFHWIPGEQEILSKLLYKLKGQGAGRLWSAYAEEFWQRQIAEMRDPKGIPLVFIPSPARHPGCKDHAFLFAKALAEITGGVLYNGLLRNSEKSQKKRLRQSRLKLSMTWSANFTTEQFRRVSPNYRVIFVDDVVTTGATAHAAWRTLGKPREFAVWSLAQRGLPCGDSSNLI